MGLDRRWSLALIIGIVLLIRLPFLVIISYLAGSVPMWLLHKATRWSMRRKLDSAERALASLKTAYPPPPSDTVPGSVDEL